MKLLFILDELVIGGSLVNAIELAASLRTSYGCDVAIFAAPGPMVRLTEAKGVRFIPAPVPGGHPSPTRVRALCEVIRHERPDVIHAWDPMACFDAYVAQFFTPTPIVFTIMKMEVANHLPAWPPITFGTPKLAEEAEEMGHRRVHLLLPPVDVNVNAPGTVDPAPFMRQYGITPDSITLLTVSRLVHSLKSESLFRTIDAVHQLGRVLPLRFLIVGDGAARTELEQRAEEVNNDLGRDAIVFAGALFDPRPAYAAADIVVGMGTSALRGMAFCKPTIVVGEKGFSTPFTPETESAIYHRGFYGIGDGDPNNSRLCAHIRCFAEHREIFSSLGQFSRQFVVQHFSLDAIAGQVLTVYREAAEERQPLFARILDIGRTAAVYVRCRKFRWHYQSPGSTPIVDVQ